MATAKRKKLLAAAIILRLKRSRKRSGRWDNRKVCSWFHYTKTLTSCCEITLHSSVERAKAQHKILHSHLLVAWSVPSLFGKEPAYFSFARKYLSSGKSFQVQVLFKPMTPRRVEYIFLSVLARTKQHREVRPIKLIWLNTLSIFLHFLSWLYKMLWTLSRVSQSSVAEFQKACKFVYSDAY